MGDCHNSAREIVQKALKPGHTFGIQVVGGFVQQNHIRSGQQQAAQRNPAKLPAG